MDVGSDPEVNPVVPESTVEGRGAPVVVAVGKQPDGSWFVTVTHFLPGGTFQWMIPLDQADAAASTLYTNIRDAATQGRRERSGLTVARSGFVAGNGQPRRERRPKR